jgi:AcrR family transcriptional regulator
VDSPSTREALLHAAADVFAQQGYEYATLTNIAAEAGLSGGSVYNYFRGKPELFLEVVRRTLSVLSVKPFLSGPGPIPGPELLPILAGRFLSSSSSRVRALVREVRYAAGHHGAVADLFDEFHSDSVRDYTLLIESWQKQGLAEPALDPELVAQIFLSELLGFCHLELVRPPIAITTLQPLIDAHVRALLTLRVDDPSQESGTLRPTDEGSSDGVDNNVEIDVRGPDGTMSGSSSPAEPLSDIAWQTAGRPG